jgi:uncharacterized protein (TIGR02611 family)
VNGTAYLTYKWARRVAVSVVGGSVLIVGVAMLVLPGPGLVVIPLGLAILGLEFAWARHWLRKARERAQGIITGRAATAQRASETTAARNSPYERTP